MKFSILIPVHNEENYVLEVLKRVNNQKKKFDLEIIVSNDGSTDKTKTLLEENSNLYDILVNNEANLGKGSAIRLGLSKAQGEFVLIQDADLEYNPNDYEKLFEPAINCKAYIFFGII